MAQVKIGIQLASLRQPVKRALQTAARLGVDAVELDVRDEIQPAELGRTGMRQLRKTLEDHRLRISAVTFRTRRGYNVEEDLDRRIAATKQAMTWAYDLGATILVNHVGHIPEDESDATWAMLLEALTDIGRHGQYCGTLFAAECASDPPSHLLRLIQALPTGSLSVNLDPGQLIIHGQATRDAVEMLGAHVVHIHARDGVRDLARGRGVEVQLGQGTADFPGLMGMLEDRGYRGYWTIARDHARDPETEISQSINYLKSL